METEKLTDREEGMRRDGERERESQGERGDREIMIYREAGIQRYKDTVIQGCRDTSHRQRKTETGMQRDTHIQT